MPVADLRHPESMYRAAHFCEAFLAPNHALHATASGAFSFFGNVLDAHSFSFRGA
jgi:hypothetical protein